MTKRSKLLLESCNSFALTIFSEVVVENKEAEDSLPASVQFKPDAAGDMTDLSFALQANIRLEFLHNDFLIYRLLEKQTGTVPDELIYTTRKILSTLLAIVSSQLRRQNSSQHMLAWNVRF